MKMHKNNAHWTPQHLPRTQKQQDSHPQNHRRDTLSSQNRPACSGVAQRRGQRSPRESRNPFHSSSLSDLGPSNSSSWSSSSSPPSASHASHASHASLTLTF